jgi:hypothetical protein
MIHRKYIYPWITTVNAHFLSSHNFKKKSASMVPPSFNSRKNTAEKPNKSTSMPVLLPCEKTVQVQNKSTSIVPTSLNSPSSLGHTSLALSCETTSQDGSNRVESPPPVVRSGSIGSLSEHTSESSIDSYAAAGFAFPGRLHKMLRDVQEEGLSHIVSWQPAGRCFVVHKPIEFVKDILHK